jgi:predicted GH43/DUF377 family glycosyl hydrolase
VVSLLAACGPAVVATSGPSTQAPTAAATPVASIAPAATAAPAVTQRFTFGKEIVVSPQLAGLTDKYVNPGAVIEAAGVLHMFANVFTDWPGHMTVPHLTSTDGIEWTLDTKHKPFETKDFKLANPGMDVSTGYIADDGTWVLIYQTVSGTNPWVAARITGPGPNGPWTIEDTSILTPGPAGSFDAGGIMWPSVVKVGDRWAMFYAGFDKVLRGKGSIGAAFSDDGLTWTKNAGPVLAATEPWELTSLDRPRVVASPTGLVMLYGGLDLGKRGLATSTDGIAWTKVPGPNIEVSDHPIDKTSWDCALLYRNGQLEYFLEIGFETTNVYRGTLTWP